MEDLINKLKNEIIEVLKLEDMESEDIEPEEPLFVEGLGLDSIDALELMVLMEKKYNIKIETAEEGKKIFYSVKSMADHILANR